jgi:hypothetical protein
MRLRQSAPSARAGTEQRSVGHPALPQSGFVLPKPRENGVFVHGFLYHIRTRPAPENRLLFANAALPQRLVFG